MFSRKQELRLENWDGRRHSTRDGQAMLPRVWSKPLLARLALVFATTVALVAMITANSPPFPYRFGSVVPHDFRARVAFQVPNQAYAAHQVESTFPDTSVEDGTGADSPPVDRYAAGAIL